MAYSRQWNIQLPTPASDDAAMMRAMLTVISSSSSSTTYPCVHPSPQHDTVRPLGAFKPYTAALAPINPRLGGHNMIKMGISILRSIDIHRRPPPTNQLHHMISERKRREKLNESFHALRSLLPPGSKKDMASILFNTRVYLKTLKDQVSELEERNRMLELQLQPDDFSSERVEVQIIQAPESTSQVQRITVRIIVRAECDMIDLLLCVLECLKERGSVSLLSVNANTFSTQTGANARLNLSLQVEAGDFDEQSFEEAVTQAMGGVVAAGDRESIGRRLSDHHLSWPINFD